MRCTTTSQVRLLASWAWVLNIHGGSRLGAQRERLEVTSLMPNHNGLLKSRGPEVFIFLAKFAWEARCVVQSPSGWPEPCICRMKSAVGVWVRMDMVHLVLQEWINMILLQRDGYVVYNYRTDTTMTAAFVTYWCSPPGKLPFSPSLHIIHCKSPFWKADAVIWLRSHSLWSPPGTCFAYVQSCPCFNVDEPFWSKAK